MGKLATSLKIGDREGMTPERLLEIMETMYRDVAEAVNNKPDIYERTTDGDSTDTFLSNGTININTSTDKVEILTNHTSATTVNWEQIS